MTTAKVIGPDHFMGGVPDRFQSGLLLVMFLQAMDGVLHHHHRAVHDHAEIDRAQAHQVGADAEQPHAEKADQHGKGNDRRRDQGGAQIAEKEQQHDRHQHEAFETGSSRRCGSCRQSRKPDRKTGRSLRLPANAGWRSSLSLFR